MLQSRDRKKNFLFLFLLIFFLSSINSQLFVKKKESLYNLNSIEVTGLDEQIKELRKKLISFVDDKFKGNDNFKKIIETSAFCSEDNNIVSDNYKIIKDKKIGIIPPIGGG